MNLRQIQWLRLLLDSSIFLDDDKAVVLFARRIGVEHHPGEGEDHFYLITVILCLTSKSTKISLIRCCIYHNILLGILSLLVLNNMRMFISPIRTFFYVDVSVRKESFQQVKTFFKFLCLCSKKQIEKTCSISLLSKSIIWYTVNRQS